MTIQKDLKTEISAKTQAFQENSANCKFNFGKEVARGAGFEPARPKGPQA